LNTFLSLIAPIALFLPLLQVLHYSLPLLQFSTCIYTLHTVFTQCYTQQFNGFISLAVYSQTPYQLTVLIVSSKCIVCFQYALYSITYPNRIISNMNFVHKIFIANPTAGPLVYVFVYTILYDRVVFLSIPTAGPLLCVL